jgi:glutamate dehydrogenase
MTIDLSATADLVETVVSLSRKRCEGERDLDRFVRTYLGRVRAEDVLGRDPADICGAAVSLWRLIRDRTPGEPNVRVYNPDWEQHGWQSPHSVVEVVTDDMPFLIESLMMLFTRKELSVHTSIHPLGRVRRDQDGVLSGVEDPEGEAGRPEALIHFEVDRISEPSRLDALAAELRAVLADVRAVVEDWPAMRERMLETSAALRTSPPPLGSDEIEEGADFLRWLDDDHFTFLGSREYALISDEGADVLTSVPGSGLGILRDGPDSAPTRKPLSATASRIARELGLLVLSKTNARSTVHRPGRMAYIGVKRFDADGHVVGELRFLGLWSRRAATASWREIPLLRVKLHAALAEAGYPPGSYNERELIRNLDATPRELAFQTPTRLIVGWHRLVADLGTQRAVRLGVFRETFDRFYSCSLFLPRDRYNAATRQRIERILLRALGGTDIEHTASIGESAQASVHFTVWSPAGEKPTIDSTALEARLTEASRTWDEELRDALVGSAGEERGSQLYLRYRNAFPATYQDDFTSRSAVADIERMEQLSPTEELNLALYRPMTGPDGATRFKILRIGAPMSLSDILPLLENLGVWVLDERPYRVTPAGGAEIWIYDFGLKLPREEIDRSAFQDAFAQVWRGAVENDGLNRLVLLADLGWRDVVVLRALCKYLRQTGITFSQPYMEECLARNPGIAKHLVEFFTVRFDPAAAERMVPVVAQLEAELDAVESLDEDRILRRFLRTMQAMLRTNHFQTGADGGPKPYLSFKVAPALVPEMPLPHPEFEIFVYSPAVEGVHLRGGAISRGGLRWSDRKEDFRTEILGLMKAQRVKNAVIVPTGAKGGFVVKRQPSAPDREAWIAAGIECYKTLISGLLDLTDNMVGGEVVPPPDVVRYDGDDAYLVVAADKGTATFSDIANALAVERGFWLGDAFASGGSAGYDHKKMGITARGAWESVKRHFRQLDIDTQSQDFTAVGVGDMSGDVFGNGMLLSEHIRLMAAFDHRHIFLDPNADAATGFAERRRLFALPRSSWADYDPKKISPGGGVFPRAAKSINLSEQARALLGIDAPRLAPNELIKAILRARVDLLWNGGIGTYVKSAQERDADVGDRTNDGVRIDATELRCRVIGEGGNLGLTQPARVEFARGGGLINTDAVDNSAGVDCSDHEVNIKILLDRVVADGDLTTKQRNHLLTAMTDEVAELVLDDNREQTQALVNAVTQAGSMRDVHARYLRHLAQRGNVDRVLEFLPSEKELADRSEAGAGLVTPEFAVVLAYTKVMLVDAILDSDIPDEPYLGPEVTAYFPTAIRERFGHQIEQHPLRREIIATGVANRVVNRAGTTFIFRMTEETGASASDVVRAILAVSDMFGARALWDRILEMEAQLGASAQTTLLLEVRKLVERATRWVLGNEPAPLDLAATVSAFQAGLQTIAERLPTLLCGTGAAAYRARIEALANSGGPADLARTVAGLDDLFPGLDIVKATRHLNASVEEVAAAYFELGEALEISWLRDRITALPRDDRWQAQARMSMREQLYREHITLTMDVLDRADSQSSEPPLENWLRYRKRSLERYRSIMEDLKACPSVGLAAVAVALRELDNLM